MSLGPRLRKLVLTTHVIASVGWIGALAAYGALVAAALTSESDTTVRSSFVGMELVYYALVPLAAVALVTGLVQALGTNWGLARHYWVLVKLVLALVATVVMLFNWSDVREHSDQAAAAHGAHMPSASHDLQHVLGGAVILLAAVILGKYKPWGLTRYGRRKRDSARGRSPRDRLGYG